VRLPVRFDERLLLLGMFGEKGGQCRFLRRIGAQYHFATMSSDEFKMGKKITPLNDKGSYFEYITLHRF